MNKIKNVWIVFTVSAIMSTASGQIVDRQPALEWANLVYGGQFKDLFLPIPMRNGFTSDTWGGEKCETTRCHQWHRRPGVVLLMRVSHT